MGTATVGPMVARSPAWRAADEIAGRQHGVITRQQCLQVGLHSTSLVRATRPGGAWQRVHAGVYAVFTGPLGPPQLLTAALLMAGPSAQLTGLTALALFGCVYLPGDPRVHVLVPASVRRRAEPGVRVHRTGSLPRAWRRDGWPVTPPDRAAVLAAGQTRSLREVRAMLAEVVQRRLTTVERLEAALGPGPSGSRLARRVVADLAAGCRSAPEMELRALLGRRPRLARGACWNHRIALPGGWVVADVCWPQARLVVEVDSVEHHGFGDRPEYTSRRRAALVAAGWTVLSVSPRRIREEPAAVLAEIEAVLARAGG